MNIKYAFYSILILMYWSCSERSQENIKFSGPIFGTGYNIQYFSENGSNFHRQCDSLFEVVNTSLSTYTPDSDISKLNKNEISTVDAHFKNVFEASKIIHKNTEGVFDPTIGNVVNAWNFGAEHFEFEIDSTVIDSLMQFVGFDDVRMFGFSVEKKPETYLEFNAIAKGYGIDVVADFLESQGVENYLVEIGGDLRVKGINIEKQKPWTVGIDDPNFDGSQSYSKVISISNSGMATSGTYRKFKVDTDGNRFAHIIDTKSGYPTKTNVLSVSVIAENAMMADGYATAFQAMGVEAVGQFLKSHPELKAYFIFENETKALETLSINGFPE